MRKARSQNDCKEKQASTKSGSLLTRHRKVNEEIIMTGFIPVILQ